MNRPLSKTQAIDWFVFGKMQANAEHTLPSYSPSTYITFAFSQLPHLPAALPISISALIMYELNVNWL